MRKWFRKIWGYVTIKRFSYVEFLILSLISCVIDYFIIIFVL